MKFLLNGINAVLETEKEDEEDGEHFPALPKDLKHIPFEFERITENSMIKASQNFYEIMNKRRTIRYFSSDPVPIEVIHNIIRTAGMNLISSQPNSYNISFYLDLSSSSVSSIIKVIKLYKQLYIFCIFF